MPRKMKASPKNYSQDFPPGMPNFGNMNQIVDMAQKIAKNITNNSTEAIDPNNMDMSKILTQVTQSVSQMVTPEFINEINNSNSSNSNNSNNNNSNSTNNNSPINEHITQSKNSKIILNNKIEEIDEDEDEMQQLAPRTKDLHFTLNVTLEELYNGKIKKVAVRRKRLLIENNCKKIVEEKKKLSVKIEPGMFDEQVITYNKQADEKEGYETGDIIITLCCSEHEVYQREGNNLLIEKSLSLCEIFSPKLSIDLINNKKINIISEPINIFGEELESYKKLKNCGMPILGNPNQFGDLIIKFIPIMPNEIKSEHLSILKDIFPPINEVNENVDCLNLIDVSESDFEYISDSDSESNSDDDDSDSGTESENND